MEKKALIILTVVLAVVLVFGLVMVGRLQQAMRPTEPILQTDPHQTAPPQTDPPTDPPQNVTDPTETEPVETDPPQPESFTLTFTGDCTLGTEEGWHDYYRNFIRYIGEDYDHPFRAFAEYFRNDDCTFINLESVLAEEGVGTPQDKLFRFRGPVAYTQIMTGSSVEFVTLANNHSYDYGEPGYISTKNALDNAGLTYVEGNSSTLFTTDSGLCIGVYAFNYNMDESDMRKEVAQLRTKGAEIVILAMHCGDEGIYRPNQKQKNYAHAAIDAGVDIVWGNHPHTLQPIEHYNGGVIFYSLGNFSFGGNHNPRDKDSAVVQMQIIRDVDGSVSLGELTIIPCRTSSKTDYNDFQPTPFEVGTKDYERVMSKLDGSFAGPDIPPAYAKPTEPSQPTEPTDPEPTDPEPTDPTDPTEPTDPTDPTDPTEPTEPTEPTDPEPSETEPSDPEPSVSEDPTEPSQPEDPSDPTPAV